MFIELAHYAILFATVVIGLEAVLLSPTLWSKGSAVAIKLGYRGACFGTVLILFSGAVLLKSFWDVDFSLAIVFENFDTQISPFYALQAFCASREGFFYSFVVVLALVSLASFSKKDLATYQERGRYLFATSFLIFALLILMTATANPFARIADPPMEGIGFNKNWLAAYKPIHLGLSFCATAILIVGFVKIVCLYSKGKQFVMPALTAALSAFVLLTCAEWIDFLAGFLSDAETPWHWSPAETLNLAVLILIAGEILLLFFCLYSRVFTNWILAFSLLSVCFLTARFFGMEYRLFTLSIEDVYFPNPVTALSATVGVGCFLLFFASAVIRKPMTENSFFVFSRESFIGLASASALGAGFSIGALALLPALFMFLPDLPLRSLPEIYKNVFLAQSALFVLFFTLAFQRRSVSRGWIKFRFETTAAFMTFCFMAAVVSYFYVPNGTVVFAASLPALLILWTGLCFVRLPVPKTAKDLFAALRRIPLFTYGYLSVAVGLTVLSASLAYLTMNKVETRSVTAIEKINETPDFPYTVELLSKKTNDAAAGYRLVEKDKSVRRLRGNPVFQWEDKKLDMKSLRSDRLKTTVIRLSQTDENTVTASVFTYPGLRLISLAIFLTACGAFLCLVSLKKEAKK